MICRLDKVYLSQSIRGPSASRSIAAINSGLDSRKGYNVVLILKDQRGQLPIPRLTIYSQHMTNIRFPNIKTNKKVTQKL